MSEFWQYNRAKMEGREPSITPQAETPKKKPVEPFKRKSERSLELLFDF